MDTGKPIAYRGFALNTVTLVPNPLGGGQLQQGCTVDSGDISEVQVVQFTEKRSLSDGVDVGDVYLGGRTIRLSGTLYDTSRAALFDRLQNLRAALAPTLSFREDPGDKGYQPLTFSVPTLNLDATLGYPGGIIYQQVNAMPRSFHAPMVRDQIGDNDLDAIAISWQATLFCKDPRVMSQTIGNIAFPATTVVGSMSVTASTDTISKTAHGFVAGDRVYVSDYSTSMGVALNTTYYVIASGLTANALKISTTSGGSALDLTADGTINLVKQPTLSGNLTNRGDYHAPLNMLLAIDRHPGVITVSAGGSSFTITVPQTATDTRIVRVNGTEKYVTIEESGVESLAMSAIDFQNQTTWPLVAGGVTPYTVTYTGTRLIDGTSHMWFWEAFA